MANHTSPESAAPSGPVVFKLADKSTPDSCLEVFGQEFHVHSVVLKLHSAFFRKFLDSAEKLGSTTDGSFRYHWLTKVDDDGTWGLESASGPRQSSNIEKFKGGKTEIERQQNAFRKLLQAMYLEPYIINAAELILITSFADYYCALRIISRTLDSALNNSPYFVNSEIRERCTDLFPVALKLRHALFFKECLTWLCSDWNQPEYLRLEDAKLKTICERAYNEIGVKIAQANRDVLNWQRQNNDGALQHRIKNLAIELSAWSSRSNCIRLPHYYHRAQEQSIITQKPAALQLLAF